MRTEEVPKPFQGTGLDGGMRSAFGLAKAANVVRSASRVADDARKTFLAAEPEVLVADNAAQSEEVLQVGEDAGRVGDQALAADEVQLVAAELRQPATHVTGVQADLYCPPRRVHRRRR